MVIVHNLLCLISVFVLVVYNYFEVFRLISERDYVIPRNPLSKYFNDQQANNHKDRYLNHEIIRIIHMISISTEFWQ